MRYLNLDQQHFNILRGNLLNASDGYSRDQVRLVGKILDKIEELGDLQEDTSYKLKDGEQVLQLSEGEYQFVNKINDTIKFMPQHVRAAIKFLDWFANASTKPYLKVEDATASEEVLSRE